MEYETFAFVYDDIMDDSLYQKWLSFTNRHVQPGQKRLLELACGTGILALKLACEGYDVTALDLSYEMLSVASEHFNEYFGEEDNSIQLTQGDMMDLSEVGRYEIVTCYSDSLCYMQNALEVQQVFDEVYGVLEANGTFIFDVHSPYKMTDVFPNYSFHEEAENYAFLWDSYPDDEPLSIVHELSFYVQQPDGSFIRHLEDHHERTYKIEHYLTMLESAGFEKVEVLADFTDNAPTETSERLFFVCHKGENEIID